MSNDNQNTRTSKHYDPEVGHWTLSLLLLLLLLLLRVAEDNDNGDMRVGGAKTNRRVQFDATLRR
jgi:hypothetical protein